MDLDFEPKETIVPKRIKLVDEGSDEVIMVTNFENPNRNKYFPLLYTGELVCKCITDADVQATKTKKKKSKKKNSINTADTIKKSDSDGVGIYCQSKGCIEFFKSTKEYEDHYSFKHRFTCVVCNKSCISQHLLDIHVSELHDSYFAILSETKPMFSCFEESCGSLFINPQERFAHCVKDHLYCECHNFFKFGMSHKPKCENAVKNSNKSSKDKTYSKKTPKFQKSNLEVSKSASFEPLSASDKKETTTDVCQINKKIGSHGEKKSQNTHIKFGQTGPRFVPRQVFAMSKNIKGEKSEENENMMDLTNLHEALTS